MNKAEMAEKLTEELEDTLLEVDELITQGAGHVKALIECFDEGDPDRARAERWHMTLLVNTISRMSEEVMNLGGEVTDDEPSDVVVSMSAAKYRALLKAAEFARDNRDVFSVSDDEASALSDAIDEVGTAVA